MITGAHSIIYSKHPKKDRTFFRDVLKLPSVDVGDGWLVFGLPPSEMAIHPSKKNNVHELYLLCDDVKDFIAQMKRLKVKCKKIQKMPWGDLTTLKLPGGGDLSVYKPLHARPKTILRKTQRRKPAKRPTS